MDDVVRKKYKSARKLRHSEAPFIVKGAIPGQTHNLAPWCLTPIARDTSGKPSETIPDIVRTPSGFQYRWAGGMAIHVACRRCGGCLEHKRRLWGARAYHETLNSYRTWFGTLTFRPALHSEAMRLAMMKAWDDGLNYGSLSESQQHALEADVLYPVIKRFFKRLRKAGYRIRYLCVPEPHESGLIHWHLLIHEFTPHQLPKAVLEDQWGAGVSHWRLVEISDKRRIWYVCKYLNKEPDARPRASLGYGKAISLPGARSARLSKPTHVEAVTSETAPSSKEKTHDDTSEKRNLEGGPDEQL